MTSTASAHGSDPAGEKYLEITIPLIAFGVTGAGLLLFIVGLPIDFQYFSVGCLISSCILAYLAWIRPKKDIVALSTPIYGIVFLFTPIETFAGAVLQLLYAAGLTILLIRLKRRFSSPVSDSDPLSADEPLGKYRDRVIAELTPISPSTARSAGRVFIRFAQGEYDEACQFAMSEPADASDAVSSLVGRAFSIVAEQAGHIITGVSVPGMFTRFSPDQQQLLFHPARPGDPGTEYSLALDNALILLYVTAISSRDSGTEMTETLQQLSPFARKLCGD